MGLLKVWAYRPILGAGAQVGQSGWDVMTYNDKLRLVFPLVPNACSCAKSDGYFGEAGDTTRDALISRWDFGNGQEVREVVKLKQNRLVEKRRNLM